MYKITNIDNTVLGYTDVPNWLKYNYEGNYYALATEQDAIGIAWDGKPYQLYGKYELPGAVGTVYIVKENICISMFAIQDMANKLFVSNANQGIVSDKDISTHPDVFPSMSYDGSLIKAETVINWKGNLKRSRNDVWDTELNNPDNAPTLWSDIQYKDGIRYIPEVITADLAFSFNELGWWKDKKYKSIISGYRTNVYNPDAVPTNWECVDKGREEEVGGEASDGRFGDDVNPPESPTEPETPEIKEESTVDPYKDGHIYNMGDRVTFNGSTYESLINTNSWSPSAYPNGWKEIV